MTPPESSAEGAAFPLTLKLLASLMVAGVASMGWTIGDTLTTVDLGWRAGLLWASAVVLIVWCLWWIWHSRTTVDEAGIRQTWIWSKQVAWRDIAQARLVAVPGLGWLIAPRLILRIRGGTVAVFHVGDPRVLRALMLRMGERMLLGG